MKTLDVQTQLKNLNSRTRLKIFDSCTQLRHLNSKAQIFSVDLMLAGMVFLFILTLSIVYSSEIANKINLNEKENSKISSAMMTANTLLYSQGIPSNWQNISNINDINLIGLVNSNNLISSEKLTRFVALSSTNYLATKSKLASQKYNLNVQILKLQNKQKVAEFGSTPDSTKSISTVNRIALYNNEEVIVRVSVFD